MTEFHYTPKLNIQGSADLVSVYRGKGNNNEYFARLSLTMSISQRIFQKTCEVDVPICVDDYNILMGRLSETKGERTAVFIKEGSLELEVKPVGIN